MLLFSVSISFSISIENHPCYPNKEKTNELFVYSCNIFPLNDPNEHIKVTVYWWNFFSPVVRTCSPELKSVKDIRVRESVGVYSHINAISSLYSCELIVQNLILVYWLQKISIWSFFHFFIPPCFLKLPPGVSFVPPFWLLYNFKMADFYVISISQIETNPWLSGTNRKHGRMKK